MHLSRSLTPISDPARENAVPACSCVSLDVLFEHSYPNAHIR
jgi:hypothetical protein